MKLKSSIAVSLTILLTLISAGCSFTNPVSFPQSTEEEHKDVCLNGSYTINAPGTTLPHRYYGNADEPSRSATAEIPTSDIQYFVTAETTDTAPGQTLTVNVPDDNIDTVAKTFSINLKTGYRWKITVGIKDTTLAAPDDVILSDYYEKPISATDTSIVHSFTLKPAITSEGHGIINLDIAVPGGPGDPSATIGTNLTISGEDNDYNWESKKWETGTGYNLYINNMASGIYTIKLTFKKNATANQYDKPVVVTQVISVYDNMTTSRWVSGGNALISSSGVFSLTDDLYSIAQSNRKTFYVDSSATNGDTNGTGEYSKPFKTVAKALTVINAVGDSTSNKVYVKAGGSETITTSFEINKNIDVIVYEDGEGKGPANPSGSYDINFNPSSPNALFNIGNKSFSITGINLCGPNNATYTSAINATSSYSEFTMHSGQIKWFTTGIWCEGASSTHSPTINLYGGAIVENGLNASGSPGDTGAGIFITYTNIHMKPVLNVKGAPKVINNAKTSAGEPWNIALISEQKDELITVVGPLTQGCDLRVSIPALSGAGNDNARRITEGYQANNGSVAPSSYFHGDQYAIGRTSSTSEVFLGQSGGSYELLDFDTITIQNAETSPCTIKMYELPLTFNFKIMKGSEEFNEALIVKDIIGPGGSSYKNDVFYSTNARTGGGLQVTINEKALPSGYYKLQVGFTNNGAAYDYTQNFTVTDGYVQTPGAHYTGSPSFDKSVFVSPRDITIPALIVCQHEVTQAEFEEYCYFTSPPSTTAEQKKLTPAYNVNWYDAIIYCNLRSKAENLTPVYYLTDSEGNELTDGREISVWASTVPDNKVRNQNGKYYTAIYSDGLSRLDYKGNTDTDGGIYFDPTANGWRLPTEAEWEYLARGGNLSNTGYLYSGSDNEDDVAWHKENSDNKVHYICTKKPNALGIYDMSGNLREWCWDWQYATSYLNLLTSPYGRATGEQRMVRGGSYGHTPSADSQLNCRNRAGYTKPGFKESETGFRVVRNAQ